ncbi:acyl-CoA thioesterase [Chryseolinea lacunae]|uniref:Thioesterase family protein n=1 Tax=Chryseolinea lacunae TaxID=2801331 RepID=A0ABS1KT23_9BACT|nr:thioesterase family protein [Chryseolinea lacunae]MBL0742504.1 thioesterase family protein [Chryseolinea lacunae]
MARIQLQLPDKFLYETEIAIRISDLNYGGHLGHDTLLTLLQETRVNFYRTLGIKDELSLEGTVGQVIADVGVQYKSEVFFGDTLMVQLGVADIHKFGFDMVYRVTQKTSGKDVAIAKTGIVCFDYATRKIAPVPASLFSKINP